MYVHLLIFCKNKILNICSFVQLTNCILSDTRLHPGQTLDKIQNISGCNHHHQTPPDEELYQLFANSSFTRDTQCSFTCFGTLILFLFFIFDVCVSFSFAGFFFFFLQERGLGPLFFFRFCISACGSGTPNFLCFKSVRVSLSNLFTSNLKESVLDMFN